MSNLLYIAHCTLCQQRFKFPRIADHIHDPHGAAIMREFNEHMAKKHQEEFIQIGIKTGVLQTALMLKQFRSQDESMRQLQEYLRYQVHDMTGTVTVTDEKLEKQVAALFEHDRPSTTAVIALVKLLRDILEEKGQFQPTPPESLSPASKTNGVIA